MPTPPRPAADDSSDAPGLAAELIATVVSVTAFEPRILTINAGRALPSGRLSMAHRSLQAGLRAQVEQQTHHPVGYLEQLYTFGDRDRAGSAQRVISISYLGLTREGAVHGDREASWQGWYRYLPWEDRRSGPAEWRPTLQEALREWAGQATSAAARNQRLWRIGAAFGISPEDWNDELVLQRYELLYEAGLVPEAVHGPGCTASGEKPRWQVPGLPMEQDHRRILATAIARLRAKIRYRPIVFELMPPEFTLLQLQRSVEALGGQVVHKQNFRRQIEQQALVEETGASTSETGGRPAKLFKFRRDVLLERAITGTKLPLARG